MTTFTGIIGKRELISYCDPHPGKKNTDLGVGDCSRCGGNGMYGPLCVYSGRCFQCGGNGRMNITVATLRRHARAAAYARDFAAEIAAFVEVRNWLYAESAYHADQELIARERAAEEARLASLVQGFVAEVGTKVTDLAVTIQVAKYCAGSYNRSSSMFIVAATDSGQIVKLFGSSQTLFGLNRGDQVTLSGKVKDHAEYNGQQQTVLGFAKAAVEEEAAA